MGVAKAIIGIKPSAGGLEVLAVVAAAI